MAGRTHGRGFLLLASREKYPGTRHNLERHVLKDLLLS